MSRPATPSATRLLRYGLWGLVALATMFAAWLYAGQVTRSTAPLSGQPYGAGDYSLIDHNGDPFSYASFLGQPAMVFFGFTHCPDVCPTTLYDMDVWYRALGEDADGVRAFFVSVDPERDTPEALRTYLGWNPRVTGVTGTRAGIDAIIDAWGVYTERTELADGGYNVDHTASVFLIRPNGDFMGTIAYMEPTETAIGKLRRLIAESAAL